MKNQDIREEFMLSDIKDNSLTGMLRSKNQDRAYIIMTIYGASLFLYFLYIHPILLQILRIRSFLGGLFLFLLIGASGAYWVFDVIIMKRKKKDKKMREFMNKGGDMINYFMKLKDIRKKDYELPEKVTVIEGLIYQTIPVEITYDNYNEYSRLLDSLVVNNITFQEFELKGRITAFDKSRSMYSKFEGTDLIQFLESIFRENERIHETSPSRRLYMLINVDYSKDLNEVLKEFVVSSLCKIQFLDERMFKEMVEQYFCAPVNLEKLKAGNKIRNVSLDGTQLIQSFNSREELEKFLETYKTVNVKNTYLYELRGGK